METPDNTFNVEGLLGAATRYEHASHLTDTEKYTLPELARLKFTYLATWFVLPEKISERHMYDLSKIDSLEQVIAITDRTPFILHWFQKNIAVLRDIDNRISDGSFYDAIQREFNLPSPITIPTRDIPSTTSLDIAA